MTLTITVLGKTIAKSRPRFVNRGKFVTTYTPKSTKEYEKKVSEAAKESIAKLAGFEKFEGPVGCHIAIWLPTTKKSDMGEWHIKRPDVDNQAKSILDSLNGIVYNDDSQICVLACEKRYCKKGEEPRAVIQVWGEDSIVDENRYWKKTLDETCKNTEAASISNKEIQDEVDAVRRQASEELTSQGQEDGEY